MWDRVSIKTPPNGLLEIVSVADLQVALRVDSGDDVSFIADLLDTAVAMIDGPSGIGYALLSQVWTYRIDRWRDQIALPGAPFVQVNEIRYLDTSGATQVLDPAAYRIVTTGDEGQIVPAWGTDWPACRQTLGAVEIDYQLGVADPAQVDAGLKTAISLMVGHWYANREAVIVGSGAVPLPMGADRLLERKRRGRVA